MTFQLARNNSYDFDSACNLEIDVEWIGRTGVVCDLDVILLTFDTRGQIIDKIDFASPSSPCGNISLLADVNVSSKNLSDHEYVSINLEGLDEDLSAIMLVIEGGTKNFQHIRSIVIHCSRQPKRMGNSMLKLTNCDESEDQRKLFDISDRSGHHVTTQSVCALVLHHSPTADDVPQVWSAVSIMQSITDASSVRKAAKYCDIALNTVPSFESYRPRLFGSLAAICGSLSSEALPGLKKIFCRKNNSTNEGLPLLQFIEVIFKELLSTNFDGLQDVHEIRHTISLLQEMFYQIDVNSDGVVDWEEFTSFCIQMGVLAAPTKGGTSKSNRSKQDSATENPDKSEDSCDIVYEDNTNRLTASFVKSVMDNSDQSSHLSETGAFSDGASILVNSRLPIHKLKFFKSCSRVAIIPGDNSRVCMLTRSGDLIKSVFPKSLQHERAGASFKSRRSHQSNNNDEHSSCLVLDVEYLHGTDSWAFCTSDHVITIAREQFNTRIQSPLVITKRMFSKETMTLLCWCKKSMVLISIDHTGNMYGWDCSSTGPKDPLFFSRKVHSESVSGVVYSADYDALLTVSLDASIINWDVSSNGKLSVRKVINNAHTRGIRTCAYGRNTILTGGFDCIGKTWDIATGNNLLLLQGHLYPIAATAIMDEKTSSSDFLYAVTADDSGEIRLWNIEAIDSGSAAREDTNDSSDAKQTEENKEEAVVYQARCLKCFNPENAPLPFGRIAHLICPYDATTSVGPFSNIIAVSCKPFMFLPREVRNEFVSPNMCIYNTSAQTLIAVVGRTLLLYDVGSGGFQRSITMNDLNFDITCLNLDTPRQRRILIGTSMGTVISINYITGQTLTQTEIHKGREVTSITMYSVKANDVADYEKSAEENKVIANKSERTIAKHAFMISSGLDGRICVSEDCGGDFVPVRSTSDIFRRKPAYPVGKSVFSKKNMLIICSMAGGSDWSILKYYTLRRVSGGSLAAAQQDTLGSSSTNDSESTQIIDLELCDSLDEVIIASGTHAPQISIWKYSPKTFISTITCVLQPFVDGVQLSLSSIAIIEKDSNENGEAASSYDISCAFDSGHIFLWKKKNSVVSSSETFVTEESSASTSWHSVSWRGHVNSISSVVPFSGHHSFLTVSHDGYIRMWGTVVISSSERNLACPVSVLGEIPLPNRTAHMRDPRKKPVRAGVWKFQLQRLALSPFARKLADYLKLKYFSNALSEKNSEDGTVQSEQIIEDELSNDLYGFLLWLDGLSENDNHSVEENRLSALCQLQSNDSSRAVLLSNVKKRESTPVSSSSELKPTANKKYSETVLDIIQRENNKRFPNRNKSLTGTTSTECNQSRIVLGDHILHRALATMERLEEGQSEQSIESKVESMSVMTQMQSCSSESVDSVAAASLQDSSLLDFDDGNSWATTPSFSMTISQWSSMRHNKTQKIPKTVSSDTAEQHARFLASSAFSTASLKKGCNEGYYGNEELAMLSQLSAAKADSYRKNSNMIIALPMKHHVITPIPSMTDAKVGELKLGLQHRLYKNASRECERTSYFDAGSRQKLVALHRISHNVAVVREIGTMAEKIKSVASALPSKETEFYCESVIDDSVSQKALETMDGALYFCDRLQQLDRRVSISSIKKRAKKNRVSLLDRQTANSDLKQSGGNNESDADEHSEDRFSPYTEDAVLTCIRCIVDVDENLTGDLDFDEWVTLCKRLKMTSGSYGYGTVKMNEDDCRTMFFNLDKDGNGRVCLKELTAVLFPLCRRKQLKIISNEFQEHLSSIREGAKVVKQKLGR